MTSIYLMPKSKILASQQIIDFKIITPVTEACVKMNKRQVNSRIQNLYK